MLLQDRFHDYDLCFLSWWYMKSFHILIFSFRILHLGLLFVKLCYNNNNITLLYDMTIWYMTLFACFTRDDFSCELTELRSSMKSQLQSAQNKSETRWGSFGAQLVVSDMRRIGWIGCFDTIPAQIAPACVRLNAAGQVRREANLPYQGQFQLKKKAWKKKHGPYHVSRRLPLTTLYAQSLNNKIWRYDSWLTKQPCWRLPCSHDQSSSLDLQQRVMPIGWSQGSRSLRIRFKNKWKLWKATGCSR